MIEPEDLAAEIRHAGGTLVLLDARTPEAYSAGHIRGAYLAPYDQWAKLSTADDTGLDHEQAWHERIGELGIRAGDTVIVYDDGAMTRAARIWFILQHFGVTRVAVVNGGYPQIPTSRFSDPLRVSRTPSQPERVTYAPDAGGAARVDALSRHDVLSTIERGGAVILDARTRDEYRGLDLRDNARGGHIPGAINIPHEDFLDAKGRLRPASELDAMFAGAGFRKGAAVITHCQGGGRAALAALAAERAGYGPVRNYYLSFGDWAADASCPIQSTE